MNGRNEKEGAPTPSFPCPCGATKHYPRNHRPDKSIYFEIDGRERGFKGQLPATIRAFMAAGSEGISNLECRMFSLNPGDQVATLRKRRVQIDTVKGKPNRWILRSQVREVLK